MKRLDMLRKVARVLLPLVFLGLVTACGAPPSYSEDPMEEILYEDEDDIPIPREMPMEEVGRVPDEGGEYEGDDPFEGEEPETSALDADDYKVALDVTKEIELNSKATLRVWIGKENYMPDQLPQSARDATSIPARIGDYARVTPFAPDFEVGPEESQTMHIVPSGSAVLFYLTPTKQGEFLISAKIELYDNPELEGIAVPKTSEIVSVLVTVDKKAAMMGRLGQLGTIVWDEFVKFWGALVAILFAVILFVVRKFARRKTGFVDTSGGGDYSETDESYGTEESADMGDSGESGDESEGADV